MKDCVWLRALLYFFIAAIPTLITDLSNYKSYGDISPIALTILIANFVLQGFIAVRAFIDQSLSRASLEKKSSRTELIVEKN